MMKLELYVTILLDTDIDTGTDTDNYRYHLIKYEAGKRNGPKLMLVDVARDISASFYSLNQW